MFGSRVIRWATSAAVLAAAQPLAAQATTTSLGDYIICRTTSGAAGCLQIGMTTAARVNNAGIRTGTTGVVTVRNLQGRVVTGPGGVTVAASNALTSLFQIDFLTPGCLPGLACGIGDYFDGMPFGGNVSAPGIASSNGSIAGTPANWSGNASKDVSAGISQLVFSAPSSFDGSNSTTLGLGGCTAGTAPVNGVFNTLASAAVRTCDAQGFTGALNLAFSTNAIFDPTFFWAITIRLYGETAPGSGRTSQFVCGVGSNRRGEVMSGGFNGICGGFAVPGAPGLPGAPEIGVVPEPATYAMLGVGLMGLLAVRRRRALT